MRKIHLVILIFLSMPLCFAQTSMDEMWDKTALAEEHPNIQWFKDAKFGMFIHWGLYSNLAGEWEGKRYYGEWIMKQAKIPVEEYDKIAEDFNPVNFDADEWATLAKDAGIRYMVITAKHHDGFAMYDSKISDFDIIDASLYKRDPLKALAEATRKRNIQFGFYYSQFQDWHEPNGGRNDWDFDESKKDYQKYYDGKAIPQLKELMTNYGPLGIIWFDTPGGMTKAQTQQFIAKLRVLQPNCLFSSRVGRGLGDYRDLGDSEVPPAPIQGAWESIYTHNDSWGYIDHDMNFKSSAEIIRLLANVASKGGNLMLNVGPDGKGNLPAYSVKYLLETGEWLQKYGESIYSTTYGSIPAQPWGVTTSKPGKLFLHVFNSPENRQLLVPGFTKSVSRVYSLEDKNQVNWDKKGNDILIDIPEIDDDNPNTVFVVEYEGQPQPYNADIPLIVSPQYKVNKLNAVHAETAGNTKVESLTYSHYFGDWKHAICITEIKTPEDIATFEMRTAPGDYKVILEYACPPEGAKQEGALRINNEKYFFRTLRTSEFNKHAPLMFIKHAVAIASIPEAGTYTIAIHPLQRGKELLTRKRAI